MMTIETACALIMGDELAHSIITDMGLHWAVVAAMAEAKTTDDPEAIRTLREYVRHQKEPA